MSDKKHKGRQENVHVYVRCRPLLESEKKSECSVSVETYPELNKVVVRDLGAGKTIEKKFCFDRVFGSCSTQDDIYQAIAAPLVQEVINGFNSTIFAYGPTGTGKTYTVEGGKNSTAGDPNAGLIPRAIQHVFELLEEQESYFEVRVSFLELYNEELFDLLSLPNAPKLKMYDDVHRKGSVIVQGLEEVTLVYKHDIYELLSKGTQKRHKAATLINKTSSRSHTIFTVTVEIHGNQDAMQMKTGKLNLVDLAGSENIGRSGAGSMRAREAALNTATRSSFVEE